jgi:hypothetical protein
MTLSSLTRTLAVCSLLTGFYAAHHAVTGEAVEREPQALHPSSLVGKVGPKKDAPEPHMLPASWTAATPYPRGIVRYAFADTGESFYVIGGVSNGTRIDEVRRYDVSTNTWTLRAPLPFVTEAPSAALFNNKIYVAEGDTGNKFGIYDIATNTWSLGPVVPGTTNRYGSAAGAFNNKVYVVGGSSTISNNVQVYDIVAGTWSPGNPAPAAYLLGGYTTVGRHLYVIGGFTAAATTNSNAMMRLDMMTGVWASGPAFTPLRGDFALASIGNKLVAIGGDANGGSFFESTTAVDEYLISRFPGGTWRPSPNTLFSQRQGNQAGFASTGRSGGEIWSTGGLDGATFAFKADHLYRPEMPPVFDFDADGLADLAVFRPTTGFWHVLRSQLGLSSTAFGTSTDRVASADFDGDGKTDIAVFRPADGFWHRINSSNGSITSVPFGSSNDLPVPADYDGDGKADVAVFRPSDGFWFRINSADGSITSIQFGMFGDRPTVADFDGDRKSDIGVYRPSAGAWFRLNSSNNQVVATFFGSSADLPTPADYDGDGRADISLFRPSDSTWYRLNSNNNAFFAFPFGMSGDKPVPADFDGDGKADLAVFRPSDGVWYRFQSTTSTLAATQFGLAGDVPIPGAFIY